MGEYYLGEIRAFAFGKVPRGWLACDGSVLQVQPYMALFSLLGTTYSGSGDGKTTFNLPDLRGRTPVSGGNTYQLGKMGGSETVSLALSNLPAHSHVVSGLSALATLRPVKALNQLASMGGDTQTPSKTHSIFAPPADSTKVVALSTAVIGNAGSGAAHDNMQPFLALNYCICTSGIYPSRADE